MTGAAGPGLALAPSVEYGRMRRRAVRRRQLWTTGPVLVLFLPPALLLFGSVTDVLDRYTGTSQSLTPAASPAS